MKNLDKFIDDGLTVHDAVPTSPAGPRKIRDLGGAELMEQHFEPLLEVVRGMILEGLNIFASNPKVGKTWLMLALALCVAAGEPFLGRPTEQGDVLFLAYEDSSRSLQGRLKHLRKPVPEAFRFDTGENIITMNDGLVAMLGEWCDSHPNGKLIVIDTLAKIRPIASGRVNAYDHDSKVLGELKTFAMKRRIALVVIHHLRKAKGDDSDVFTRINGSSGLTGTADSLFVLERDRGTEDATLYCSGREIIEDEIPMRFHSGLWTAVDAVTIERERYEAQPVVKAVKALLAQSGRPVITYESFKDFSANRSLFVGATKNEVHKALDKLAGDFARFDGIHFQHKQVGSARGFEVLHD